MTTQKFTNFDYFQMCPDMTAVTIQSNKDCSNKVKDKLNASRAMFWEKTKGTSWPT